MGLTKETVIDKIEILEDGTLQVRRATYVVEDGIRIAGPMYHRVSYPPGADTSSEDDRVKAHAAIAWTLTTVAAFRAKERLTRATQ